MAPNGPIWEGENLDSKIFQTRIYNVRGKVTCFVVFNYKHTGETFMNKIFKK